MGLPQSKTNIILVSIDCNTLASESSPETNILIALSNTEILDKLNVPEIRDTWWSVFTITCSCFQNGRFPSFMVETLSPELVSHFAKH